MTRIGPGSFVDPAFALAEGVRIGRNCTFAGRGSIGPGVTIGDNVVIDGDVEIGAQTHIAHHVVITGTTRIGAANRLFPSCCIGESPQDPARPAPAGGVVIGDRNVLREFVTIHAPSIEAATVVGDDCYLMVYCHVSHDCRVGDRVKMAIGAALASGVVVDDYSYLGMRAVVHQRLHLGAHCMIGMGSAVTKNVPPFAVVFNGQFKKVNRYGLLLRGVSEEEIDRIDRWYRRGPQDVGDFKSREMMERFVRMHEGERVYKWDLAT